MSKLLINGKQIDLSNNEPFAFLMSNCVFTTFLAHNSQVHYLTDHLKRLKNNAEELSFAYPGDQNFLSDLEQLLSRDSLLRIRLTVGENIRISQAEIVKALPAKTYTAGVKAIVTPYKVSPDFAHIKTGNYLPYFLAQKYAQKQNCFEGFLHNQNNYIVDASKSSPLHYENNILTILQGGLEGITRKKVATEASKLGMVIKNSCLKAEELTGQVLLCGSGMGLVPVGPPIDKKISRLIESFPLNRLHVQVGISQ